jgi:cell division protein FtsB
VILYLHDGSARDQAARRADCWRYHLVQGERGLLAWLRLNQEIKVAQAHLADLDGERSALEGRVALLRPEHLDRDMLDERARATLNLAGPREIIILRNPASR